MFYLDQLFFNFAFFAIDSTTPELLFSDLVMKKWDI